MTIAIKTASSLSFERRLSASDAVLTSGSWNDISNAAAWPVVPVVEKTVRGTISNRQKAGGADLKLMQKLNAANIQRVDAASLPLEHDTLGARFTLKVLPGVEHPGTCNDPVYAHHLAGVIGGYIEETGMRELAHRYVHNIASGRFFWRNRVGAEEVLVRVTVGDDEYSFSDIELGAFDQTNDCLDSLAAKVAATLSGKADAIILHVESFCLMGAGQEIYPSQEFVENAGNKGKWLYQINGGAGMHSQKIGNAIRSIDDWYSDDAEHGAIAVEVFGSVTTKGLALRAPSTKQDFYNLLDGWMTKGKVPALEQQHYVVAVLIRGGVFGEKGE